MPQPTHRKRTFRRTLKRVVGSGRRADYFVAMGCVALATGGILLSQPSAVRSAPIPPQTIVEPIAPPNSYTGLVAVPMAGSTTQSNAAFTVSAAMSQGAIYRSEPAYLEVTITGNETAANGPRRPVDLALVLDTSGSMSGEKIQQAKNAVTRVVESMQNGDRFALVTYDQSARVVVPLMDAIASRSWIRQRIQEIVAGGGTNIPAGLQTGFAALQNARNGRSTRVVLVSDGLDGSGMTAPQTAQIVQGYSNGGVTVASLGIGLDYDEQYLTSVADAGRGNYAFLANGTELGPFVQRELTAASRAVANLVNVDLRLPADLQIRRIHGANNTGRTVALGSISAGEVRKFVVELGLPAGASQGRQLGAVGLTVNHRLPANLAAAPPLALEGLPIVEVPTQAQADVSRAPEVYVRCAAAALDTDQAEALQAWRQGDIRRATAASASNAARLRGLQQIYAAPEVAEQIEEVERDEATFNTASPASAAGRGYGLRSNATRRQRARSSWSGGYVNGPR